MSKFFWIELFKIIIQLGIFASIVFFVSNNLANIIKSIEF